MIHKPLKLLSYFSNIRLNQVKRLSKDMDKIKSRFKLPERYGIPRPNVWLEMSDLQEKYNPVNLGMGFPDYAPPKHVTKALEDVAYCENIFVHQYTRAFGHMRLVNILCKLYSKLIGRELDESEMLVTAGAQQGIYAAFQGFLEEGDEIIVIEPFFEPYEAMIKETGAKARFIPLKPKRADSQSTDEFYLDKEELEGLFNDKTKAIIVNTPNNPLGKVFNMEEMQMIADLCQKWNVLCISDEVYEWMVYKPYQHIRMATLPGMWERTLTVGSAGKTFSITGWRTGWVYGPANLINNLYATHQNCIYTHCTPIQEALAIAFEKEFDNMLNNPKECYFYTLSVELERKREFLLKAFADAGIKAIRPQGGYMFVADVENLAKKIHLPQDYGTGFPMAKWMVEHGLLGIPGSPFYSEQHAAIAKNYIRFCFVKKDELLQQAAEALQKMK